MPSLISECSSREALLTKESFSLSRKLMNSTSLLLTKLLADLTLLTLVLTLTRNSGMTLVQPKKTLLISAMMSLTGSMRESSRSATKLSSTFLATMDTPTTIHLSHVNTTPN